MWPAGVALGDEYYRLFTAMFLHGSLLHIGFNMLVLWMLGPQLEHVLGHLRFTVLYLVAGLGGSVASFWFSAARTSSASARAARSSASWAPTSSSGKALRADISQVLGLIGINIVIGFVVRRHRLARAPRRPRHRRARRRGLRLRPAAPPRARPGGRRASLVLAGAGAAGRPCATRR